MENINMVNGSETMTKLGEADDINVAIPLLNDLIAANRGIVQIYETAQERVREEANAEMLQRYAAQHTNFVAELSNLIIRHGGDPTTSANGSSLLKQAWVTLKAAFTEGDGPILTAVANNADTLLSLYGEVISATHLDDAHQLISRQMSEVNVSYKKLSALSAALEAKN